MIEVDELILEVTRRCNMKCEHCLRGEAQNLSISNEIIDKVFDEVGTVNSIVYTGGEPSLNTKAIKYSLKVMKERNTPLFGFWLATNAKTYNPEFFMTVVDLFVYCLSCGGEPETCGIAVSIDDYHERVSQGNIAQYKALSFYSAGKEQKNDYRFIVDMGRASEKGIGYREHSIIPPRIEVEEDGRILVETLYINAKGDVLSDCDLSYELQEEHKMGNIFETPLEEILLKHSKKELVATL